MSYEISVPISHIHFGQMVDLLGSPSAVRAKYVSPNASSYGTMPTDIGKLLGHVAELGTSYPITLVIGASGEASLDTEKLKEAYRKSVTHGHSGVSPVIIGAGGELYNISDKPDERFPAFLLKDFKWKFRGDSFESELFVLADHYRVKIRYFERLDSDKPLHKKLNSLEALLREKGINHSIGTFDRFHGTDHAEFFSSWDI